MEYRLLGSHWFLRSTPRILGRARHAVYNLLLSAGVGIECRERAVIACDELLCQAADAEEVLLSVCVASDHVRVAVSDAHAAATVVPGSCGEQPLLGLTLVWQLSRDFYVRPLGDGRTVAAEITRYEFGLGEGDGDPERTPA